MAVDPRVSDEATGLPPLEDIEPETTIVVLAWDASEGVAALTHGGKVEGAGEPVRYLHARGLVEGGPSGVEWAQIHLAIPVAHALDVAAAIAKGSTERLGDD